MDHPRLVLGGLVLHQTDLQIDLAQTQTHQLVWKSGPDGNPEMCLRWQHCRIRYLLAHWRCESFPEVEQLEPLLEQMLDLCLV
jgi:hypothetical protein